MNFIHISSSFLHKLHHNKIGTSATNKLISEPQNCEFSNDDDDDDDEDDDDDDNDDDDEDDDDDDECTSINANITFNNVSNALKQLYPSSDDDHIRQHIMQKHENKGAEQAAQKSIFQSSIFQVTKEYFELSFRILQIILILSPSERKYVTDVLRFIQLDFKN